MKRLAIITTHPIQYNAPLFKLLTERNKIKVKVFYTWENSKEKIYDHKFGREIKWDIPLLDGYDYTFVKNIAKHQGSHAFNAIDNPTLIKEIEQWQAEAVLIYGWNFKSHFKAMRHFKGKIPVLFRGDSTLLDETKGFKTLIRRIALTFVYKFIDYALYVGTNNKNYYLKHGVKHYKLIFAPHAIDNDRFFDTNREYEQKAKQWRQQIGFKENDIVFLFVGKFEPKKNPLLLIEAANHFPEYKFLFVGNGTLENQMKAKATKNVKFLPFQNQSQMPIVYRLGDFLVLPSQGPDETWGLTVNEAMACGKPVIVSDKVGCAIDLVENNKNGFIFTFNDKADFFQKLAKIASNKQNIENYSKYSLQKIRDWNFEEIAKSIEQTIE